MNEDSANLPLPDFLGIGVQKSGTGWLHVNLRANGRVCLPLHKEVHFFDKYFDRGLKFYATEFVAAGKRLKGEITPSYSILPPERIAFIRKHMPRVKLILLLRNPIDRAWSEAVMDMTDGGKKPWDGVTHEQLIENLRGEENTRRSDYETILANWEAVFPPEQLFVGFYDDLVGRPTELLAGVFGFLGLSTDVDWSKYPYQKVVFKGPDVPMPAEIRGMLREMYEPAIGRLARRFGPAVERWLAK